MDSDVVGISVTSKRSRSWARNAQSRVIGWPRIIGLRCGSGSEITREVMMPRLGLSTRCTLEMSWEMSYSKKDSRWILMISMLSS